MVDTAGSYPFPLKFIFDLISKYLIAFGAAFQESRKSDDFFCRGGKKKKKKQQQLPLFEDLWL